MKITDIKAFPVQVAGTQLVVKVETDAGIYGVGEAGLPKRALAVIGAIQHYREFLLGRDPMRIGGLWQEMYRSQYFEGGRILTAAIAGIDIALHDIVGKALGGSGLSVTWRETAGLCSLLCNNTGSIRGAVDC